MLDEGRLPEAVKALDSELSETGDRGWVGQLLGTAHLRLGQQLRAQGDLDDAAEHVAAAAGLAAVLPAELRLEIVGLEKALGDDYYRRGITIYRQDIDEAIRCWEQSIKLNPEHAKARLRLSVAYKAKETLDAIGSKEGGPMPDGRSE